jgi:hypothetical protein
MHFSRAFLTRGTAARIRYIDSAYRCCYRPVRAASQFISRVNERNSRIRYDLAGLSGKFRSEVVVILSSGPISSDMSLSSGLGTDA